QDAMQANGTHISSTPLQQIDRIPDSPKQLIVGTKPLPELTSNGNDLAGSQQRSSTSRVRIGDCYKYTFRSGDKTTTHCLNRVLSSCDLSIVLSPAGETELNAMLRLINSGRINHHNKERGKAVRLIASYLRDHSDIPFHPSIEELRAFCAHLFYSTPIDTTNWCSCDGVLYRRVHYRLTPDFRSGNATRKRKYDQISGSQPVRENSLAMTHTQCDEVMKSMPEIHKGTHSYVQAAESTSDYRISLWKASAPADKTDLLEKYPILHMDWTILRDDIKRIFNIDVNLLAKKINDQLIPRLPSLLSHLRVPESSSGDSSFLFQLFDILNILSKKKKSPRVREQTVCLEYVNESSIDRAIQSIESTGIVRPILFKVSTEKNYFLYARKVEIKIGHCMSTAISFLLGLYFLFNMTYDNLNKDMFLTLEWLSGRKLSRKSQVVTDFVTLYNDNNCE
ncbi:hypothetical protein PFISCL1PPCAC_11962, partial [Pristionchus fissidentatus]